MKAYQRDITMDAARQIENLIYRYAELIDQGELQSLAELFRHAAIVSPEHGTEIRGCDAVLKLYQGSCRLHPDSGTPLTKHLTSNVIIEVASDDESASARSYYTVIQATEKLPLQPIISGHYHDYFVKAEDQTWQFKTREMYIDLMGDCSEHLLYAL
jgi:3-phenylpropionate/cinnamic acid dioxygenase small subunit